MHWVSKKELGRSSLVIQVSQHRKVPSRRIVGGKSEEVGGKGRRRGSSNSTTLYYNTIPLWPNLTPTSLSRSPPMPPSPLILHPQPPQIRKGKRRGGGEKQATKAVVRSIVSIVQRRDGERQQRATEEEGERSHNQVNELGQWSSPERCRRGGGGGGERPHARERKNTRTQPIRSLALPAWKGEVGEEAAAKALEAQGGGEGRTEGRVSGKVLLLRGCRPVRVCVLASVAVCVSGVGGGNAAAAAAEQRRGRGKISPCERESAPRSADRTFSPASEGEVVCV